MEIILIVLGTVLLAAAIHETGHWLVALYYGQNLQFEFAWGKIGDTPIIPRFVWYMPTEFTNQEKRNVAIAGFFAEFLAILPIALFNRGYSVFYVVITLLHIGTYHIYAGDSNDFRWLR